MPAMVFSWITMFILLTIFILLFTLKGCSPTLADSQQRAALSLETRQNALAMLNQPVYWQGQAVTLAYLISRESLPAEQESRKAAIKKAFEDFSVRQQGKYCVVVGKAEDDLMKRLAQTAGKTLVTTYEQNAAQGLLVTMGTHGCQQREFRALETLAAITLPAPDNSAEMVVVVQNDPAAGSRDLVYMETGFDLVVGGATRERAFV